MGRLTKVNYQMVADYCSELHQKGEKPNLETLHLRLGGSYSTLGGLRKQWLAEQNLASKATTQLSAPFQQALLAEFERVAEGARQNLKTQLAEEEARLQETQDILKEHELKLEQITEEYAQYKQETENNKLQFEKTLSATQALLGEKEKQVTNLNNQLEKLRERANEAEQNTVIWKTRHQEGEKQKQQLEQEIKKLRGRT